MPGALVNELKNSPEILETPAVTLNNMRREEDDPRDDGSAPFHLC
jgi:hypothetical protein